MIAETFVAMVCLLCAPGPAHPTPSSPAPSTGTAWAAGNIAAAHTLERWQNAYADAIRAAARHETVTRPRPEPSPRSTSTVPGGSCPALPAWIVQRESRCTYTARNASGAGGAYQLMQGTANEAARRIGHPELIGVNAADWPPALQDAGAAAIWAGGAGACNWTPPNYCA